MSATYVSFHQLCNYQVVNFMVSSLYFRVHDVEMQRYIDISSYRDTLGSDTVSIHI